MKRCNPFLKILNEYLNNYIIDQKGMSKNTQRSYKYTFQLLIDFFYTTQNKASDKLQFRDLTYENLTFFLNWIENTRGCSASTRNQRLAGLKSFSVYAQSRDVDAATVFRNSVLRISSKKLIPNDMSYFTREEVKYLLAAIEDSAIGRRNKTLLAFMYASGARAQEVCDVKVTDISNYTSRATVILHGKGNKHRRITIPEQPSKMLFSYLMQTGKYEMPDEYIFSSRTRSHMTIACIEEIFKKYIAIAKSQHPSCFAGKYSPHTMRHTTATHMVEAGIPLLVIKNFLGHTSIETTQVYAKVTDQYFNLHAAKWNAHWLQSATSTNDQGNRPVFLR